MRETRKIGFVCFAWAFLGALFTLAAALQYELGWWLAPIGALASGALAYLSYDWRGVGRAFRQAWRKTIGWRPVPGWKDNLKIWHYFCCGPALTFWIFLCLAIGFVVVLIGDDPKFSVPTAVGLVFVPFVFLSVYGITLSLFLSCLPITQGQVLETRAMFRKWNLLAVLFWHLPRWLWRGSVWFVQMAPVFVGVLLPIWCLLVLIAGGNFIWTFFRFLHSAERRICFTAVFVGVVVGFAFGYPHGWVLPGALVGGATGGLLGILEYHVVAIRWLGIVPVKQTG